MIRNERLIWPLYEEQDVFWSSYVEIEQTKKVDHHWLNVILSSFNDCLKWLQTSQEEENSLDDHDFRYYYIHKTKYITFIAFLFNLCYQAVFLIMTPLKTFGLSSPLFSSKYSIMLEVGSWVVLTVLTLIFYSGLILKVLEDGVFDMGNGDLGSATGKRGKKIQGKEAICNGIRWLGNCVLLTRLLILLHAFLINMVVDDKVCIVDSILSPKDTSFRFASFLIIFEMYQMFAFAVLPIATPWIYFICLIEATSQVMRVLTCYDRIGIHSNDYDTEAPLLFCVTVLIASSYLFVGIIPSRRLEASIHASYEMVQKIKEAAEEKKGLVNLLCSDLKVPLHSMGYVVQKYNRIRRMGSVVESDKSGAVSDASIVPRLDALNYLIDHILVFLRIEEGRFRIQYGDVIDLSDLVETVLAHLTACHGLSTALKSRVELVFRSPLRPHSRLHADRRCWSILLFYLFSALLTMMTVEEEVNARMQGQRGDGSGNRSQSDTRGLPFRLSFEEGPIEASPRSQDEPARFLNVVLQAQHCRCEKPRANVEGVSVASPTALYLYQSYLMMVEKVLRTLKQSFTLTSTEEEGVKIEFTIPYKTKRLMREKSKSSFRTLSSRAIRPKQQPPGPTRSQSHPPPGPPPVTATAAVRKLSERRSSLPSPSRKPSVEKVKEANDLIRSSSLSSFPEAIFGEWLVDQLCVYVDNHYFQPSIEDILDYLLVLPSNRSSSSGGYSHVDIPIFHHLNMADLQIRSIVIVTSYAACRVLREKGYRRLIILLSERLSYLDEQERLIFNYALSWPCPLPEMKAFRNWLLEECCDGKDFSMNVNGSVVGVRGDAEDLSYTFRSGDTNKYPGDLKSHHLGISSNNNYTPSDNMSGVGSEVDCWTMTAFMSTLKQIAMTLLSNCWPPPIDSNSQLNYLRWLRLNPTTKLFHKTTSFDLTILANALIYITYWLCGVLPFAAITLNLFPLLIFLVRRFPVGMLTRWGRGFLWAYRISDIVLVLSFLGGFMVLFASFSRRVRFSFLDMGYPQHSDSNNDDDSNDASSFLNRRYGIYSGRGLLLMSLAYPVRIQILFELISWNYAIIPHVLAFLLFVRIVKIIISPLIARQAASMYTLLLLTIFITITAALILSEALVRREFLALKRFILTRDTLDRAMVVCCELSCKPLQHLLTVQEVMMEDMMAIVAKQQQQEQEHEDHTHQQHKNLHHLQYHLHADPDAGEEEMGGRFSFMSTSIMKKMMKKIVAQYQQFQDIQLDLKITSDIMMKHTPNLSLSTQPPVPQQQGQLMSIVMEKMDMCLFPEVVYHVTERIFYPLVGSPASDSPMIHLTVLIHPSLYFIRCDVAVVKTWLSNACRSALRRIFHTSSSSSSSATRSSSSETTSLRNSSSSSSFPSTSHQQQKLSKFLGEEIAVLIEPMPGQEELRFTDVRMLHLHVLETCYSFPLSDENENDEEEDGLYKSSSHVMNEEAYRRHLHARFLKSFLPPSAMSGEADCYRSGRWKGGEGHGLSENMLSSYRYYQRIAVPYRLTPLSHKMTQHFQSHLHRSMRWSVEAQELPNGRRSGYCCYPSLSTMKDFGFYYPSPIPPPSLREDYKWMSMVVFSCDYQDRSSLVRAMSTTFCCTARWERQIHYLTHEMPTWSTDLMMTPSSSFLVDCVLIDSNLSSYQPPGTTGSKSVPITKSSSHSHRSDRWNTTNDKNSNNKVISEKDIISTRNRRFVQELIVYLRGHGYGGIIAELLPALPASSNCNSSSNDSTVASAPSIKMGSASASPKATEIITMMAQSRAPSFSFFSSNVELTDADVTFTGSTLQRPALDSLRTICLERQLRQSYL